MKLYRILCSSLLALITAVYSSICAEAVDIHSPITANESNATVWIFAIVIGILAAAGIVFFIVNSKKK